MPRKGLDLCSGSLDLASKLSGLLIEVLDTEAKGSVLPFGLALRPALRSRDLRVEGRLGEEGWLGSKPRRLAFLRGDDSKPGDDLGETNHAASGDANP